MEKTFELKTFKRGVFGVDCKYIESTTEDDGTTTTNEFHIKASRPTHPDLDALFNSDLPCIIAKLFGDKWPMDDRTAMDRFTCTGISLAGKDDNIGITIDGIINVGTSKIKFKTPRMKYKLSDTEAAAMLTVFADKVVEEVHAYLFEGKSDEMEVFE